MDGLTALQDATQAELDALLPSVLDRTFRGELWAALGGWEAYEQLAEELRKAWPADQRTQDLMDAIRR